jgi:hypothetical protein
MFGQDPRLGETGLLITASVMLDARILVTHHRSVKNNSSLSIDRHRDTSIGISFWYANALLYDFRYLFQPSMAHHEDVVEDLAATCASLVGGRMRRTLRKRNEAAAKMVARRGDRKSAG